MNITGYKRKIKENIRESKQGEHNLGTSRFRHLQRQIICWKHCIENLRKNKKKR